MSIDVKIHQWNFQDRYKHGGIKTKRNKTKYLHYLKLLFKNGFVSYTSLDYDN